MTKLKKTLSGVLSGVLIISALFKLTSISYTSGILFSLLPVAWLDTFIAAHLDWVVISQCG